jgi:hypothetical protein
VDTERSGVTSCQQADCPGIRKEKLKKTTKVPVMTAAALWNELQRYELH